MELDLEMVHAAAVHSEKRSISYLRRIESRVAFIELDAIPKRADLDSDLGLKMEAVLNVVFRRRSRSRPIG